MPTPTKMFPNLKLSKDVEQEIIDAVMTYGINANGVHMLWEDELREILGTPINMEGDDFCKWDMVSRVLQFSSKLDPFPVPEENNFMVVYLDPEISELNGRAEYKRYLYDVVDHAWY